MSDDDGGNDGNDGGSDEEGRYAAAGIVDYDVIDAGGEKCRSERVE